MSYTYLQEQGEESSVACFSDIPAYVLLRLNLIHDLSSCSDREMGSCRNSQSGMMLRRSMGGHGRASWMWYAEDSPVRTYLPLEGVKGCQVNVADYGLSSPESLAKFDPTTYSWRTAQCSLLEGLTVFSGTFPAWGSMQNGELFQRIKSEDLSIETVSGLLPAPLKSHAESFIGGPIRNTETWETTTRLDHLLIGLWKNWKGREGNGRIKDKVICHPTFSAWLLLWPLNWTNLEPLEMGKFQQWQHLHSLFSSSE